MKSWPLRNRVAFWTACLLTIGLEIELTAQAEADLVEIGDFIAKDNLPRLSDT
jgi:hypothetical protein